jgi:hypothetical protein
MFESPGADVILETLVVSRTIYIISAGWRSLANKASLQWQSRPVPLLRLLDRNRGARPYRSVQAEVRDVQGQEVTLDVICQVAIRFVHAAEIIKVAALAKGRALIRVIESPSRVADEVDEAFCSTELDGYLTGMLLRC